MNNKIQRGDSILAAKAGFWYVVGNFVGRSVSFLTTPIFARLMTVSDYGDFSNFAQWASVLLIIVTIDLYQSLPRAYFDFKNEYNEYISTITILGFFTTSFFYLTFLIWEDIFFNYTSIPSQYIHLLSIYIFFSFCRSVYQSRERTLYRYKSSSFITFLSFFVPTLISVFLVFYLSNVNKLCVRLYGFYIPSILIGVFCAFSIFSKSCVFKLKYCKYAILLSLPLLINSLTTSVLVSSNVMISKAVLGAKEAAIISLASSAIHLYTFFNQAVSGALSIWIMDNLNLGKQDLVKRGLLYYFILNSLVICILILFTPEVIGILGGKKYLAATLIMPSLLVASFLQSVATVFTIILTYAKNVIKASSYTFILALISIVLKISLVANNGVIVLAHVNIMIFGSLLLISYFLVKHAGYADSVSFKGLLVIILIIVIITICSQYLYSLNSIRYILIGFLTLSFVILAIQKKRKVF